MGENSLLLKRAGVSHVPVSLHHRIIDGEVKTEIKVTASFGYGFDGRVVWVVLDFLKNCIDLQRQRKCC
jgi:hypothetical protein